MLTTRFFQRFDYTKQYIDLHSFILKVNIEGVGIDIITKLKTIPTETPDGKESMSHYVKNVTTCMMSKIILTLSQQGDPLDISQIQR